MLQRLNFGIKFSQHIYPYVSSNIQLFAIKFSQNIYSYIMLQQIFNYLQYSIALI